SILPAAPHRVSVKADRSGYVAALEAERIGRATMLLGAGRDQVTDTIDPGVGAIVRVCPGDAVGAGDVLIEMHYRDRSRLEEALALTRGACRIEDEPPAASPLVLDIVSEEHAGDGGVQ